MHIRVKYKKGLAVEMSKLIQKVEMDIMDISLNEMYIYGEATLEENLAMQEPLEKLYQYENQPNMIEKIAEYISELETEYDRCVNKADNILAAIGDYDEKPMPSNYIKLIEKADIINDLKERNQR